MLSDFRPKPNLHAIEHICELVGGQPLALEMAASWVNIMPCEQIAEQLSKNSAILAVNHHDVPERQRDMQLILNQSWQLLTRFEQVSLMQMGLFQGEFSADALNKIVFADCEPMHRLKCQTALLNKALLHSNQPDQFRLHPLVRQYALSKLAKDAELEAHAWRQFSDYYVDLLADWRIESHDEQLVQLLAHEIEHINMVWDWLLSTGNMAQFSRLVRPMRALANIQYWFLAGKRQFGQAIETLAIPTQFSNQTLKRVQFNDTEAEIACALLTGYAQFCDALGEQETANGAVRLSMHIARRYELEQHFSEAQAIFVYVMEGTHLSQHRELILESIALNQDANNPVFVGQMLFMLYTNARSRGDYIGAEDALAQLSALLNSNGFSLGVPFLHFGKAWLQLDQGDVTAAHDNFETSMAMLAQFGLFEVVEYNAKLGLGITKMLRGEKHSAEILFDEATKLTETSDSKLHHLQTQVILGKMALHNGYLGRAKQCLDEGIRRAKEMRRLEYLAEAILLSGYVAYVQGDAEEAKGLWIEALQEARNIGAVPIVNSAETILQKIEPERSLNNAKRVTLRYLDQLLIDQLFTPEQRQIGHISG